MDTYHIVYMKCSYTSDYTTTASSLEEAVRKFYQVKGDNCKIIKIDVN